MIEWTVNHHISLTLHNPENDEEDLSMHDFSCIWNRKCLSSQKPYVLKTGSSPIDAIVEKRLDYKVPSTDKSWMDPKFEGTVRSGRRGRQFGRCNSRGPALVPVLPASWASGLPCAQEFCNKVPSLWPCSASTHSHGTSDCELRPPDSALKQFGCLWTVSGICHSNKIYFST